MRQTTFDAYSSSYQREVQNAVRFTLQDVEVFTRVKIQYLVSQVRRQLGEPHRLSVLDVGCGVGLADRYLVDVFDRVTGIDPSAESIRKAAADNPRAEYHHCDGTALPFPDGQFDLAFAMCVLHHVPPLDWDRFVTEMRRVVRPGGLVLVFEHNPWNPLTRLAVSRCPFDADAVLLSMSKVRDLFRRTGLQLVDRRFILFTPWDNAVCRMLDSTFRLLPLGGQYLVAGRRSPLD